MCKVEKKKNVKYNNILEASFTLFEENGITAVPIDDIVKKAGVAKGTFYLYFKDKMDLISKIILLKATDYLQNKDYHKPISDNETFEDYIKKYIDSIIDFLQKNITLTSLIDNNTHICVNAVIENHDGALNEIYNKIIEDFSKKGISEDEIRIKMYLYLNMIVSSSCNAILREKPYKLDDIKKYLYNIIISSIEASIAKLEVQI